MFYVYGGEWETTEFKKLKDGKGEAYGPFATFQRAVTKWRGLAQGQVDNAHHRMFVSEKIPPELGINLDKDDGNAKK